MEKELNIAAILKDKPKGTKLYSTPFGECTFDGVTNDDDICFLEQSNSPFCTDGYGKYSPNGECLVFPSKQMPNWSKFAWKKGDVLQNRSGYTMIFFAWFSDDYTKFNGSFAYSREGFNDVVNQPTSNFRKVSDEEAKEFIKKVEEHYGGKLNLETLGIEQPKQEFKEGDIVFAKCKDKGTNYLIIYKSITNNRLNDYCSLNMDSNYLDCTGAYYIDLEFYSLHSATNLGMQQLFSALEKKNKRWNPDTKQIEDLPKKYELKPFDKVLAKIAGHTWTADFFSHYDENDEELPYVCIGYGRVIHCIPYNDETKHLLGTTDEWKGGEG